MASFMNTNKTNSDAKGRSERLTQKSDDRARYKNNKGESKQKQKWIKRTTKDIVHHYGQKIFSNDDVQALKMGKPTIDYNDEKKEIIENNVDQNDNNNIEILEFVEVLVDYEEFDVNAEITDFDGLLVTLEEDLAVAKKKMSIELANTNGAVVTVRKIVDSKDKFVDYNLYFCGDKYTYNGAKNLPLKVILPGCKYHYSGQLDFHVNAPHPDPSVVHYNGELMQLGKLTKVSYFSSCGYFALVPLDTENIFSCSDILLNCIRVDDVVYNLVGGPVENLRACLYNSIHKYLTVKMITNRDAFRSNALRTYKKFYGSFPGDEGIMDTMVDEPWVPMMLKAQGQRLIENRKPMIDAISTNMLARAGLVEKWFNIPRKLVLALVACGACTVGVLLGPVSGLAVAFLGLIFTGAYIIMKGKAIIFETPEEINSRYREMPSNIIVPCAMKYIRKTNLDPDFHAQIPTLGKGVKLVEPDPVDVKEHKHEIYGASIKGVEMVMPANTSENLSSGLAIRMGFQRSINNDTWNQFEKHAKRQMDLIGHFILNPEETETFLVKQYGTNRAAKIMENKGIPLDEEDAWSTLFPKAELYCGKNPENYKTRMIWSRSLKILYYFANYFSDFGKQLANKFAMGTQCMYTSKSTPETVGYQGTLIDNFGSVFEMDVSNWDGSLHNRFLLLEKYFFENYVHGWPDRKSVV